VHGEVETLVREWRPERAGGRLPLRDGRHEHDMTRRARRLSRGGLEGRFRLPVALSDERLYSVTGASASARNGPRRRKHKNTTHYARCDDHPFKAISMKSPRR